MKNDIATVKQLISLDIDLNKKSQLGRSPIHWAIINNNTEIVALLIKAKCDIEVSDKFEMKPILMAAMVGNLEMVKMLIEAGCNCRVVNKKQQTVLHCAVKHDQNEILAYLLDNVTDIDINAVNEVIFIFKSEKQTNSNIYFVEYLVMANLSDDVLYQ
ncbi:hypothetical protein BLA29_011206 [Euroglyphus maynei]|uniref:Alpha-latrotoxin n=1 Tax=Euroglyphus maynei TaxID=6958 RepID=A0A1Y3B7W6_EURMA|nr:hypothetical protein BLA29_011206 [Euroglyphus maynei]